ncbi:MAG: uroporphyrinogen decarboxylase, partial [Proteobacteria bacterium]|nr:uroporphyrinogen decarboxylase [Pseudomonadota bacterium]
DFMGFCLNQEMVVEATLQPIVRFGFDAAIIFSDILVVPHFLGQTVHFKEGVGPILEHPDWEKILDASMSDDVHLIYESIKNVRRELDSQKALIGFVGCPWTIASYMISEGKTNSFDGLVARAKTWPLFNKLMDKLTAVISDHAVRQLKSGANVVQLFESWASAVPDELQQEWLFEPAEKIIHKIQKEAPEANVIYYAKGIAQEAIKNLGHLNIGFGVSQGTDLSNLVDTTACLQGNLDPQKLLSGDFKVDVLNILEFSKDRPFIVNLGHGILPETPISHVEEFISLVRSC